MITELIKALEWARSQQYQSVAAQYAKTIAKAYDYQCMPRRTAVNPPTEADGTMTAKGWTNHEVHVLAWDTLHKTWESKSIEAVAGWPEDFPYWCPMLPDPEKEGSNT